MFEGNTFKHIVTDIDVASRCKVTRSLRAKKANLVVLVLGAICKKGGVFKYLKMFQGDKSDATKLLKKHNADTQTIAAKY